MKQENEEIKIRRKGKNTKQTVLRLYALKNYYTHHIFQLKQSEVKTQALISGIQINVM